VSREQDSLERRWQEYRKLDRLTEHWYWRPGWRQGRRFYTWHITFDGQVALYDLARRIQAGLDVPGLDPVPMEGLHLTMQGLGFTDEVSHDDAEKIVEAARTRCAAVRPFQLTLGPVDPDAEATALLVAPWAPVEQLRLTIRDAIGSVWPVVPEPEEGFRPHVTVAYSGASVPVEPIREHMTVLRDLPPVEVSISEVQLIALNRDERVYAWDVVESVPLGG
jgi:2'-5' RNA ligase